MREHSRCGRCMAEDAVLGSWDVWRGRFLARNKEQLGAREG
jgi:hypothetical protein